MLHLNLHSSSQSTKVHALHFRPYQFAPKVFQVTFSSELPSILQVRTFSAQKKDQMRGNRQFQIELSLLFRTK